MSNNRILGALPKPPKPSLPVLICSKAIVCALPVTQIALGAVHLDDCPLQHYIPIYLIVSGVFGLVLGVLACLPCTQDSEEGRATPPMNCFCTVWNSLTSFFLFCWFIAGNVWIYSIYEPNYNKNSTSTDLYCDKTLYLFAFWTTTLTYILFGILVLIGICVLICLCFCKADPDDNV